MATPTVPAVLVTVHEQEDPIRLVVSTPAPAGPVTFYTSLSCTELADQRARLAEDLEGFTDELDGPLKVTNWAGLTKALSDLHRRGRILLGDLFPGRIDEAGRLFREACRGWDRSRSDPKLVEVVSGLGGLVPLELLPLFKSGEPGDIKSPMDLDKVCRGFLGFSAYVKRSVRVPVPPLGTTLDNVRGLPVKFFADPSLGGACNELAFFKKQADRVDLDGGGSWPSALVNSVQLTTGVANALWNPDEAFDGSTRRPPDQLLHFSCHCDTSPDNSENHYLELSHDGNYKVKTTLGDLSARLGALGEVPRRSGVLAPLVFMNACHSSVLNPNRVSSLLKFFLIKGLSRGYIGTEVSVPDNVASAFSVQVYRRLFEGESLRRAFVGAKRTLMARYNNPLGLVYTAYADPDLRLRRPLGRDE